MEKLGAGIAFFIAATGTVNHHQNRHFGRISVLRQVIVNGVLTISAVVPVLYGKFVPPRCRIFIDGFLFRKRGTEKTDGNRRNSGK